MDLGSCPTVASLEFAHSPHCFPLQPTVCSPKHVPCLLSPWWQRDELSCKQCCHGWRGSGGGDITQSCHTCTHTPAGSHTLGTTCPYLPHYTLPVLPCTACTPPGVTCHSPLLLLCHCTVSFYSPQPALEVILVRSFSLVSPASLLLHIFMPHCSPCPRLYMHSATLRFPCLYTAAATRTHTPVCHSWPLWFSASSCLPVSLSGLQFHPTRDIPCCHHTSHTSSHTPPTQHTTAVPATHHAMHYWCRAGSSTPHAAVTQHSVSAVWFHHTFRTGRGLTFTPTTPGYRALTRPVTMWPSLSIPGATFDLQPTPLPLLHLYRLLPPPPLLQAQHFLPHCDPFPATGQHLFF